MTDDEKEAMYGYACNDAEREFDLFAMLLPLLTRPEFELPLARHTHGLYWSPKIAFDFPQAEQLIVDMTTEIDLAAERVGHTQTELRGNISFVKILEAAMDPDEELPEFKVLLKAAKKQYHITPTSKEQTVIRDITEQITLRQVPMKVGKATKSNPTGMIPAFAKTDEAMIKLKEHPDERVRNLVLARQAVKSWPLHIKRVSNMMAQARATGNGRLCVPLGYHKAHTGRFAGMENINLQNLAARNAHPLILKQRGLLIPPDGCTFIIADASQVEARGTAWVARQDDLLADFEAGVQIYCQFASEILGKKVRKARSTDPPMVAKYLKRYRDMGKVGILGAGYGMGWERCMEFAKNTYGIILTPTEAKNLISHYRERYPKIPKFWYKIEKAFKFAVRYPGEQCDLDQGLSIYSKDDCTFIVLPSGRQLRYEGAKVVGTGREEHIKVPNPRQKNWTYVWGGYLTENIVQAICRDLLAEAILDLEHQGVQIGLHCHDEIIAVVPATEAESATEKILTAMRKRPSWATTFPLDAEAIIAERYGKG